MGMLVGGIWTDRWYDTNSTGGRFKRKDSSFRNWIRVDGSTGFENAFAGSDFQDSSGTAQPEGLELRSDRNSTVLSSITNSSSEPYLVADRAGFEPTSPAPKAGRISRLP